MMFDGESGSGPDSPVARGGGSTFDAIDANGDGVIDRFEWEAHRARSRSPIRSPPGMPPPPGPEYPPRPHYGPSPHVLAPSPAFLAPPTASPYLERWRESTGAFQQYLDGFTAEKRTPLYKSTGTAPSPAPSDNTELLRLSKDTIAALQGDATSALSRASESQAELSQAREEISRLKRENTELREANSRLTIEMSRLEESTGQQRAHQADTSDKTGKSKEDAPYFFWADAGEEEDLARAGKEGSKDDKSKDETTKELLDVIVEREASIAELQDRLKAQAGKRGLTAAEKAALAEHESLTLKMGNLETYLREVETAMRRSEGRLDTTTKEREGLKAKVARLEKELGEEKAERMEDEQRMKFAMEGGVNELQEELARTRATAAKDAEMATKRRRMLEEEVAKSKTLLAEMGRNQEKFQLDLEAELQEAHRARAAAVGAAEHAEMNAAHAERDATQARRDMEKMEKELAFLRETLVTRLSEAGKKAALMIEEVEEAAALRVAEMEETLQVQMDRMRELDEMANTLQALKPTPVSKFSVKNLLKQVKAMEKEVQLLRGSVSERQRGTNTDESDDEKPKKVASSKSAARALSSVRRSSSVTPVGTPRATPKSTAGTPKSLLSSPKGPATGTPKSAAGTPRSTRSVSRARAGTIA